MHLLALTLLLGVAQALLVPPPPGPYSVAVEHIELIDPNRTEPFAPEANATRRFMASAYLPVDARYECEAQVVPYMPALTASVFGQVGESLGVPQEMLSQFEMEFCDISTIKLDVKVEKKEFPVAVFSPGLGGTRFVYGALARSLASLGYIVITVDHTYDALVVEFPDGSVAYAPNLELGNGTLTLPELNVIPCPSPTLCMTNLN
jgi:predicted dienelactone hydrolase